MRLVSLVGLTMVNVVKTLERHGFFWIASYNKPIALVIRPEVTREEFEETMAKVRAHLFSAPVAARLHEIK